MKGIAKGLAFLHEFSPKRYVHGNLKPSNILLGEDLEPCISDFGLGRLANIAEESPEIFQVEQMAMWSSSQQSSPYEFTTINSSCYNGSYYQAPEASKGMKPSQKWDVYSFGMILLEMITGKCPNMTLDMDVVQWIQLGIEERKPLSSILDPSLFHDNRGVEDNSIEAILKLALACVQKNPDRRPTMKYVNYSIEKFT